MPYKFPSKYTLVLTQRPHRDNKGNVLPEDRQIFRRYQSVTGLMRKHSWSEEQAVAYVDRPKGICEKCSTPCAANSRRCGKCRNAAKVDFSRRYRSEDRHLRERTCVECGLKFIGLPKRDRCDEHLLKVQPGKGDGRWREGDPCEICQKPVDLKNRCPRRRTHAVCQDESNRKKKREALQRWREKQKVVKPVKPVVVKPVVVDPYRQPPKPKPVEVVVREEKIVVPEGITVTRVPLANWSRWPD